MVEMFGYDREAFDGDIAAFTARLHPDDAERVAAALQGAIDSVGSYAAEYRVVLPGGDVRWIDARGRALADPEGRAVRVLGAAYDVTARQDQEERVRHVLESMSAGFYAVDADWRFTYVNAEAERLLGRPRAELLGGVLWELFPAALGTDFETSFRRALATGERVAFDAYYPAPLDGWYELRALPTGDGLWVFFLDVTARRRAQEAAEQAAARAHLRAEVTAQLTGTLDIEESVGRLAQLVVPALADWCIVTVVEDDPHGDWRRRLRDVSSWHRDAAARDLLARYQQLRLGALVEDAHLSKVGQTLPVLTFPTDATRVISEMLVPGEARDLLLQLAPGSATALPLPGRGRTVGLLTLFNSPERGPLDGQDLETAQDVAGRAGLALDNARLYEQQRQLAEALQRSLLTDPPEPDHLHVVVRYQPAAEVAQVGGDWYDAFLQPSGATVLVIGDVIGHDTVAAAAMGQVRGLLRGIAADSGEGPAEVLRRVDRAMQTLRIDTTASVVVARLEQTDDERSRGVTRLRWSNAGHPPPLVLQPDGTVTALPELEQDLLLGIAPDLPRTEQQVTLDRGSTVLLYTDGLIERRGQSLDEGFARLRRTLEELADESLAFEDLCDEVLARMLPAQSEDDVALVAVRLHRQDRPRPIGAGRRELPDNVEDEPEVDPQVGLA